MSRPNRYLPHYGLKQTLKAARRAGAIRPVVSQLFIDVTDMAQAAKAVAALTPDEVQRLLAHVKRLKDV